MRKFLLGLALVGVLSAPPAFAQSIVPNSLTGNECWTAGQGPSGPSSFVCATGMRNATGYQLITPTPSGTYTPSPAVSNILLNGQPAASTVVTTPVSTSTALLYDGALFSVCNTTSGAFAANTTTIVAATGQTINGGTITITTLAAFTCVELQYVLASTTWYRIQ